MSRAEVIAALASHGYSVCVEERRAGWEALHFAKKLTGAWGSAVDCYFDDQGSLAYVQVDGRSGPQVTCEGIRLIGRVPSELAQEMQDHVVRHDLGLLFGPTGDFSCDSFQLELGAPVTVSCPGHGSSSRGRTTP
ncbi:hypothetical protein [Streptomyces sp. NPDC013181]|uniref:hypothetical protein n=1 Tax=Streptomyces sp. NPDC013181 TaxID=3364864 RepID=UPI00368E61D2